jgi:hypothetical protein
MAHIKNPTAQFVLTQQNVINAEVKYHHVPLDVDFISAASVIMLIIK